MSKTIIQEIATPEIQKEKSFFDLIYEAFMNGITDKQKKELEIYDTMVFSDVNKDIAEMEASNAKSISEKK